MLKIPVGIVLVILYLFTQDGSEVFIVLLFRVISGCFVNIYVGY